MNAITIRPAVTADLPRLIELQTESPEAAQWSESHYLRAFEGAFSLRCLVAEQGGSVEGMVVYRGPIADEAEVLNLAVSRQRRRTGVGRALILWLIRQHDTTWHLEVRGANRAGIAFYRHCGFTEVGRRKQYYRDPADDAIVMKRAAVRT